MINIRTSVFETNSSSTHSVTIASSGSLKSNLPCKNGVIKIGGDEFGWGPEEFTDAKTKLSYLITCIFSRAIEDKKINWKKVNKDWWIKVQKAVEDQTGCILEVIVNPKDIFSVGYIDHQSLYVAEKVLNKTVGKIKRFVFNPKSVLVIDNDNDTGWGDY
jgi:hypothetical protein